MVRVSDIGGVLYLHLYVDGTGHDAVRVSFDDAIMAYGRGIPMYEGCPFDSVDAMPADAYEVAFRFGLDRDQRRHSTTMGALLAP